MKNEKVLKALKGYLELIDAKFMSWQNDTVYFGRGEIKSYIPKLILLQKYLANNMFTFDTGYFADNYAYFEKDLKKGIFPIFVRIHKKAKINESHFKEAINQASKEYARICCGKSKE